MNARAEFPPTADLPIPTDAAVAQGWTGQMIEMADHIGAYATLRIVEAFGGEYLYIAQDPERNALRPVIGPEKAAIMSHVYGRERLRIPTARSALLFARRQPVIAAVRKGDLTITDAARMLGSTQPYVSHLLNHTDEGKGMALPVRVPQRRGARETRQIDLFGDDFL